MVGKDTMTEEEDEVDSLDVFNQQCEDVYLDSLEPNLAKGQCEHTVRSLEQTQIYFNRIQVTQVILSPRLV